MRKHRLDYINQITKLYIEACWRDSLRTQRNVVSGLIPPKKLEDYLHTTKEVTDLYAEREEIPPNNGGYQAVLMLSQELGMPTSYVTDITYHIRYHDLDCYGAPTSFGVGFYQSGAHFFHPQSIHDIEHTERLAHDTDSSLQLYLFEPTGKRYVGSIDHTRVSARVLRDWLASQIDPKPYKEALRRIELVSRWQQDTKEELSSDPQEIARYEHWAQTGYNAVLRSIREYTSRS